MQAELKLNQLKSTVSVGVYAHEQVITQMLSTDIIIRFEQLPEGCHSDELGGTICYDTLIQKVQQVAASRHFNLIEHFAAVVLQTVTDSLGDYQATVQVAVTKDPGLDGLLNATFSIEGHT